MPFCGKNKIGVFETTSIDVSTELLHEAYEFCKCEARLEAQTYWAFWMPAYPASQDSASKAGCKERNTKRKIRGHDKKRENVIPVPKGSLREMPLSGIQNKALSGFPLITTNAICRDGND